MQQKWRTAAESVATAAPAAVVPPAVAVVATAEMTAEMIAET